MTQPREALRTALARRDAAAREREDAKATLDRADEVLHAIENEIEEHAITTNAETAARAREISAEIKAGRMPVINTSTDSALADAQKRLSIAANARHQLAAEFEAADAKLHQTDQAADAAALAVIVAEAQEAAAEVAPAFRRLVEISDHLHGAARLWAGGKPVQLPLPVAGALSRLKDAALALDSSRPSRAISAALPEAVSAAHLERYRQRLQRDADVELHNVEVPVLPGAFDHMPVVVEDLLGLKNIENLGRLGPRPQPTDQPNGADANNDEGPFFRSHGMKRKPDILVKE